MNDISPTVEILMATYNGERFIAEQIKSVQMQSYQNWKLTISDDNSSDKTTELINSFAELDSRISLLPCKNRFGSAKQNFFNLISKADHDYTMFSDQDDYWLPDKIEISVRRILELEEQYGKNTPILVSTDAIVADAELNETAPSFLEYERFAHTHGNLPHALVENNVCGCTLACNRTLINLAKQTTNPKNIVMHDWWLHLLAQAYGKTELIDVPTIKYRQHSNNSVGTHGFSPLKIVRSFNLKASQAYWITTKKQAEQLLATHRTTMPKKSRETIENYISLLECSRPKRLIYALRGGYVPTGITRRIGQAAVYIASSNKCFTRGIPNE